MTTNEKEKIKKWLSEIMPGFKAAKYFFDAFLDDNYSGRIDVSRPKMTKALENADKAINELIRYVIEFEKEEDNGVNTEKN